MRVGIPWVWVVLEWNVHDFATDRVISVDDVIEMPDSRPLNHEGLGWRLMGLE